MRKPAPSAIESGAGVVGVVAPVGEKAQEDGARCGQGAIGNKFQLPGNLPDRHQDQQVDERADAARRRPNAHERLRHLSLRRRGSALH